MAKKVCCLLIAALHTSRVEQGCSLFNQDFCRFDGHSTANVHVLRRVYKPSSRGICIIIMRENTNPLAEAFV
jgi:hypothetical protein